MKRLLVCLLAVACSKGAKPGPERPVTGKTVPCPTNVEAAARKAWGAADATTVWATCAAFYAGEPLWLLDGWTTREEPPDSSEERAVVRPDGEVMTHDSEGNQPLAAASYGMGDGWKAVDLDGDGRDELLDFGGYGHGGYAEEYLIVYRVGADYELIGTEKLALGGQDESGDQVASCASTHQILDDPKGKLVEIVGTVGDPAPEACPLPGRHVYRWDGKEMVEVP